MSHRFQQKLKLPIFVYVPIERVELLEQLDRSVEGSRLIMVAAPAGWGKTVALGQWVARGALPAAWYTLDSSDRDPHIFLDYLLHGVAAFVPRAGELGARLAAAGAHELPEIVRLIALEIANAPAPFTLVLDDFHAIEDDPGEESPRTTLIFDLLGMIVKYAANCHLVIATRALPTYYDLARLAVQQRASVFDQCMLQFSPAEVQQLASTRYGQALSDEHARRLAERFDGWAAGIVLAIEHDAQIHSAEAPAHPGVTMRIHDYIAEQIFGPFDGELQQFLKDVSILDTLTPHCCDMLRGTSDAAYQLAELRRRCLLISNQDASLSLPRAFRAFLRMHLAQHPAREQALLRRAGDLYRDKQCIEQAIESYLMAGAVDQVIELLRTAIPRFRQRAGETDLLTSFERLAASLARSGKHFLPPDLLLVQAQIYSDLGMWNRAEMSIKLAETIGDALVGWEARIMMADLLIRRGEYLQALAILADVPFSKLPPQLQLAYHLITGRAQIMSGTGKLGMVSIEAAQLLAPMVIKSTNDPSPLANIYDNLGWAYTMQGDRRSALGYLRRADAYWQEIGNSGRRAATLNMLGRLAMDEHHYAQAHTALTTGLQMAEQAGYRREELLLRCHLAELALLEGELEQALALFSETHLLTAQLDIPCVIEAAAIGALWAAVLLDDSAAISTWQRAVAKVGVPKQPDTRGRYALARSMLNYRRPTCNQKLPAELVAEAAAVEQFLLPIERAYLALLHAALIHAREGWPGAAAAWQQFEQRSAHVADAALRCFAIAHYSLFEAAAPTSQFACQFVKATEHPPVIRWRITALGAFTCQFDETPCALSSLHRTLLVRLLDAGRQGIAIERLWEDVWGNDTISMTAFHTALSRLRSQTGLTITARDGVCAIQSPWEQINYDVQALEQSLGVGVSRKAVQRAMALYGGDFLPGETPGATQWADARRTYLQQRYLDFVEQFACAIEHEAPDQAIHYYQEILRIDACREQVAACLMQLAARFGKRSLVNTTFEQLEGALRILGATPDPRTTDLYQQLH